MGSAIQFENELLQTGSKIIACAVSLAGLKAPRGLSHHWTGCYFGGNTAEEADAVENQEGKTEAADVT
jgi:hypothetical protein